MTVLDSDDGGRGGERLNKRVAWPWPDMELIALHVTLNSVSRTDVCVLVCPFLLMLQASGGASAPSSHGYREPLASPDSSIVRGEKPATRSKSKAGRQAGRQEGERRKERHHGARNGATGNHSQVAG